MKIIAITALLAVFAVACTEPAGITARPDPNTSSSGTLGSVKATDGVRPLGETNEPQPRDTILPKPNH